MLLIDSVGRKTFLVIGNIILLGSILIVFIYSIFHNDAKDYSSPWELISIFSVFVFGYGLGLGPVPWIYFTDILPDVGVGIAISAL